MSIDPDPATLSDAALLHAWDEVVDEPTPYQETILAEIERRELDL